MTGVQTCARPISKAVFEKFADYVPRQEPASWLAGGKTIVVNRIEWITIPDPATAAAALQNAEVDWLEVVLPDLLPILRKNRNLATEINDPLGLIGALVMNHLYPPFNDVRRGARSLQSYWGERSGLDARAMGARPGSIHRK